MMLSGHIWMFLGALPGSTEVLMLAFHKGSFGRATEIMTDLAIKYFGDKVDTAKCDLFDVNKSLNPDLETQLENYFRGLGFAGDALDKQIKRFQSQMLQFLRTIKSRRDKNKPRF